MAKGHKRGNGEGSKPCKRKDGHWVCRYTVQSPNGPRRKSVYGKTRAEAAGKRMKAILERDSGSPIVFDPEKLTGSEYLNRWLNASAKFSVGPNPFHRYAAVDKNDLAPAFGTVSSRDLALATVRYTLGVLSVAMNKA